MSENTHTQVLPIGDSHPQPTLSAIVDTPNPDRPFHHADGRFNLAEAARVIAVAKERGWIRPGRPAESGRGMTQAEARALEALGL